MGDSNIIGNDNWGSSLRSFLECIPSTTDTYDWEGCNLQPNRPDSCTWDDFYNYRLKTLYAES